MSSSPLFLSNETKYNTEDIVTLFREFLIYGKTPRYLEIASLPFPVPMVLHVNLRSMKQIECRYSTGKMTAFDGRRYIGAPSQNTRLQKEVQEAVLSFHGCLRCAWTADQGTIDLVPESILYEEIGPLASMVLQGGETGLPLFFSAEVLITLFDLLHLSVCHTGRLLNIDPIPYILYFIAQRKLSIRVGGGKDGARVERQKVMDLQLFPTEEALMHRAHLQEKSLGPLGKEERRVRQLQHVIDWLSPSEEQISEPESKVQVNKKGGRDENS